MTDETIKTTASVPATTEESAKKKVTKKKSATTAKDAASEKEASPKKKAAPKKKDEVKASPKKKEEVKKAVPKKKKADAEEPEADKIVAKVKKTVKEKKEKGTKEVKEAKKAVKTAAKEVKKEVMEKVEEVKKDINKEASQIAENVADALKEGTDALNESADTAVAEFKIDEEYLQSLSSKSLKEILQFFQTIIDRNDQQEMYKYSEAIKASFYKALKREKIAIGFISPADAISDEKPDEESSVSVNPFAEIERGFKDLYAKYKSSRAEYLQELEHKKEDNLAAKYQIIEELKSLLEAQEDLNKTFPEFRALQSRWRESGPVPQGKIKDIYDTYQHYVEMFYDYVKINNELRDLDFKKNLEAKVVLCEKAEALINEENIVNAFARLQKLHEEWKELGPVEKEHRETIWERFKEATAQINKKHQSYFENIKVGQKDNLIRKTALCEKAEEIAVREIVDSNGWNKASKDVENLQKEWKSIGFASKKDNQKIYDRFRAACDKFYNRKREYYSQFKDQMSQNMDRKIVLCEQAEALVDSIDWKKTTDALIALQKQWKEIGPVSRKKSEQIWNRFRAACDKFFDNKEKSFGGVDPQYVENLEKKRAIIAQVNSFESDGVRENDIKAMRDFFNSWNEIGFVPFKEKDKVQNEFKAAIDAHFAQYRTDKGRNNERKGYGRDRRTSNESNPARSERERLVQKFRKIESEIATYENNMGFFASSKNADAFISDIKKKIESAKAELKELESKIKSIDNQFE